MTDQCRDEILKSLRNRKATSDPGQMFQDVRGEVYIHSM